MMRAPARSRRPWLAFAARWAVLGGLLAVAIGLGMGFAHASAASTTGTVDAVMAAVHHSPGPAMVAADGACPGCLDHDQGAMVACFVTLMVVALISALRPSPGVRLVLRRPLAQPSSQSPGVPARAPDLAALGICRT